MSDLRITCVVELNGATYRIDAATPDTFAQWFAGVGRLVARMAHASTLLTIRSLSTFDAERIGP